MLVAYLYTRAGRAFLGKLCLGVFAFTFGAATAQVLVAGIPTDPGFLLQEYDGGASSLPAPAPSGDVFVPAESLTIPPDAYAAQGGLTFGDAGAGAVSVP